MADEPHEVVKLLLARMESHPEEFEGGMSNRHTRWRKALEDVFSNLTDEEAKPLQSALNKVRLDEIHKSVMDELLNGDERRRMEEAEYEAELIRKATILKANTQMYPNAQALGLAPGQYSQANQNAMQQYQNAMGNVMGVGTIAPSIPLDVANGGTGATPLERAKKFFSK